MGLSRMQQTLPVAPLHKYRGRFSWEREVASIPMPIWLGAASKWVSFSSHAFHPSWVRALVIGLTTTLLSGRLTQPDQDLLPMSISQTYLVVTSSSGEEADGVVFIAHLLLVTLSILGSATRCCLAPR